MSSDSQEFIRIFERLSPAKRSEVMDFSRFLLARESDERWDQIIASTRSRPALDAFLKKSAQEPGDSLDLDRL
jgi:hypothetical protein